MSKSVLIFGYGFIGSAFATAARQTGYTITATARTAEKRQGLLDQGLIAIDPADETALRQACDSASTLLITPAPDDTGCPAFATLHNLVKDQWIGYLSTTGVYGDRGGGWVFEDSDLNPTSREGRRRVLSERQWLSLGAQIFRLPGLYGPGRNVVERLMAGTARRIHKRDHVFSRLHHDDCATALMASLNRPRKGGIYNLCDDEPAPADVVLAYAAHLCGLPLPPEIAYDDPALSGTMQRFYRDNKRVSNARAKAELGWRPLYPTYREGLSAIFASLQAARS
ncbi:MAG: SDR family oxidoreductase [Asticcacaulis sp.]